MELLPASQSAAMHTHVFTSYAHTASSVAAHRDGYPVVLIHDHLLFRVLVPVASFRKTLAPILVLLLRVVFLRVRVYRQLLFQLPSSGRSTGVVTIVRVACAPKRAGQMVYRRRIAQ